MRILIAILFIAATTTFSFARYDAAQDYTDNRYFLGSSSFSEGSTIRASNQAMVCTADGIWENTNLWASGCLRDGKISSEGFVQNVTGSEIVVQCQQNGTWKIL